MASVMKADEFGTITLEKLRKFPKPVMIKLGAKTGSGFVFCGRTDELDFDEIDKKMISSYKRKLKNAEQTLKKIQERPKRYSDFVLFTERRNLCVIKEENKIVPSQETYMKWLKELARRALSVGETKDEIIRRLDEYTPLKTRKLIEVAPSLTEEGTFIFLYEGNEACDCWTKEEYDAAEEKIKNKKKDA